MSWANIETNWENYKSKVHQHWPLLNRFDLDSVNGDRDLLIKIIVKRYGMSEDLANNDILVWQNNQFEEFDSTYAVLNNLIHNS